MNDALHGLRFVAALLEVMHHEVLPKDRSADTISSAVSSAGYCGITIFFVLSGFVIYYKYYDVFSVHPFKFYWPYIVRRFARIYPLYAILLIFYFLNCNPSHPLVAFSMTQALFPSLYGIDIGQAWTLTVEMLFYLIVPMIIFFARLWPIFIGFLILAFAIAVVLQVLATDGVGGFHYLAFNTLLGRLFEFAIGMSVAKFLITYPNVTPLRAKRSPYFWAMVDTTIAAGLVLLVWFIGFYDIHFGKVPSADMGVSYAARDILAFGTGAVVLRLMARRRGALYYLLSSKLMASWGKYSYAIYLIHAGALWVVVGRPSSFLLEMGLIIVIAHALYTYIEEPMRRWVTLTLDVRFVRAKKQPMSSPDS